MVNLKRTFWEYLKSDKLSLITIPTLTGLIGIYSAIDGVWIIFGLMVSVGLVYFGGSYIDWKKRG